MVIEVITPDKLLYKGHIDSIVLPGVDGSFGMWENHAPIISALTKGTVKVKQATDKNKSFDGLSGEFLVNLAKDESFEFDINGGVVEVQNNKVTLLAN
ncbi:MAG: hypothetical protein R2799_03715 [Crocinitomicaceae bacterium]|nr:F0F1 ATP synthase subunit epsilon [Crocinitomicaceae bacterium]